MNIIKYNENRYTRLKQWFHIRLGLQQLVYHPFLNFLWIVIIAIKELLSLSKDKLISLMDVPKFLVSVFSICLNIIVIFFPIICAIGLLQLIGNLVAKKDEANMDLIFSCKKNIINQTPILISKKLDNRMGVTWREFYTAIPLEKWKENREAISDILNIHIIGNFSYGGRKHDKGNHICFKSGKGRLPKDRGTLYDDQF